MSSSPGSDARLIPADTLPTISGTVSSGEIPQGTLPTVLAGSLLVWLPLAVVLPWRSITMLSLTAAYAVACFLWLIVLWICYRGRGHHPHRSFGSANAVTTLRAAITTGFAGVVVMSQSIGNASAPLDVAIPWWLLTTLAVIILALDGVDGALARSSGLGSAFGARFDMEIDALLALMLALLLWRSGIAGIWVLALGVLRYAFIAAATVVPALTAPLYPSMRRKLICVIQLAALCLLMAPVTRSPIGTVAAVIAVALLAASFLRDILWLLKRSSNRPATSV